MKVGDPFELLGIIGTITGVEDDGTITVSFGPHHHVFIRPDQAGPSSRHPTLLEPPTER